MASQFDPRERGLEHLRKLEATNAPNAQVLRTSQTLQAAAEIPKYQPNMKEPAPRMQSLFNCLQARFG